LLLAILAELEHLGKLTFPGSLRLANDAATVRGAIAYVPQRPWLLNDTIGNNVSFSRSQLPDKARLDAACKACGLGPDILRMPAGLDTMAGDGGQNLSGGRGSASRSHAPCIAGPQWCC